MNRSLIEQKMSPAACALVQNHSKISVDEDLAKADEWAHDGLSNWTAPILFSKLLATGVVLQFFPTKKSNSKLKRVCDG